LACDAVNTRVILGADSSEITAVLAVLVAAVPELVWTESPPP